MEKVVLTEEPPDAGVQRRTKGSMVGRAKEEGLEISLNDCLLGQGEMPVMDGVEAATEKADPVLV